LLLGYALSGDTVVRETPLKVITFEAIACQINIELTLIQGDWNIGLAEQAGYIYLNPVKAETGTKRPANAQFHVILPLLFYEYFVTATAPGDLLNIEYVTKGSKAYYLC
jgi:hypothetical protein